ncbi:hypothetical protein ACTFIU_001821 [Dictyostelium citrinum]
MCRINEQARYKLLNNELYYNSVVSFIRVNSILYYRDKINNNNSNNNQNEDTEDDEDESDDSTYDEEMEESFFRYGNNNSGFQTYGSDGEWDGEMEEDEEDEEDGDLTDGQELEENEEEENENENENEYDSASETDDPMDDYSSGITYIDGEDASYEIYNDYYSDEDEDEDEYEDEEEEEDDDDERDWEDIYFEFIHYVAMSLRCPLTQDRIYIPAKTINCEHNQCFDLKGFIINSCITGRWLCPVCDIDGRPLNLIIDLVYEKQINAYHGIEGFIH